MENRIKEQNKKLIKLYPWLLPRNRYTDKVSDEYDYSYTELDGLEPGWKNTFGLRLCEEIQHELNKLPKEEADTFRILQIKEKYASLRFYANWETDVMHEIIHKYEKMSKYICGHCGKKATRITCGYWYPLCDECASNMDTIDINDFYSI